MRRTLGTLLAFALVPVLVLSGTQAANAATNLNAWHTTVVVKRAFTDKLDFVDKVECAVSSRYSANGYGVEWANSECLGSIDASPNSAQFGEAGSVISLIFRGTYDGAAAPSNYTESKHGNNLVSLNAGASTCLTKVCTSGRSVWNNVSGGSLSTNLVYAAVCWNGTTVPNATDASWANWNGGVYSMGGYYNSSGTYTAPWPAAQLNYTSYSCPAGQTLYAVAAGLNAAPTQANIYVIQQELGPGVPQEGDGAGTACEVETPQLTLTASPADGWSGVAGLIPSGSAVFDPTFGHCQPDQVCIHYVKEGWGDDVDAEYCGEADWGTPAAVPAPGDSSPEPVAPTPTTGHDNPATPETESGFWEAILGALSSGFVAVVSAVSAISSSILNGLSALFVPSFASWGIDGLIDQARARAPFSVVAGAGAGVQSIADAYEAGGGCGSLANFTSEDIQANLTCTQAKDSLGMGTLYGVVQIALWSLTGLGIFKMIAGAVGQGS